MHTYHIVCPAKNHCGRTYLEFRVKGQTNSFFRGGEAEIWAGHAILLIREWSQIGVHIDPCYPGDKGTNGSMAQSEKGEGVIRSPRASF